MNGTAVRIAKVRALASSGEAQRIRERAGLTRGDVARDLRASIGAVRRWELGERAPCGELALKYGRLLDELAALETAS
jgi:DNA-binding transcriptional regulator YiaG